MGKKLQMKGTSTKLTPLEFMILLRIYESGKVGISGYDIIKELNRSAVGLWTATSGTIYPILSKMKDKRLLNIIEVKSEIGPAKKVYKITKNSKKVVETMLLDNFEPELSFFSNYLDFVLKSIILISKRDRLSTVDLEHFLSALELFSVHIKKVKNKLKDYLDDLSLDADDAVISRGIVKCPSCGQEILDPNARYCSKCGHPMEPDDG
ncbi:MAG: helix-turn-helix transcriptional regulator [Promethearchaeota archaeon]